MKTLLIIIFFFSLLFASCKDDSVSSSGMIGLRLDGDWNLSMGSLEATLRLVTVNNTLSGKLIVKPGLSTATINGSFTDSTLNFNFLSQESFGIARWEAKGVYDLFEKKMVGTMNVYHGYDSLILSNIGWFASRDTLLMTEIMPDKYRLPKLNDLLKMLTHN